MLDLAEWEAGIGRCGMHHEWTTDPDAEGSFTFETEVCPACARTDQYLRMLAEKDRKAIEKLGDDVPAGRALPGDGRIVFIRPMTPAEMLLARRSSGAGLGRSSSGRRKAGQRNERADHQ